MLKSQHINVSLLLEMEFKNVYKISLNNTISYVGDLYIYTTYYEYFII